MGFVRYERQNVAIIDHDQAIERPQIVSSLLILYWEVCGAPLLERPLRLAMEFPS